MDQLQALDALFLGIETPDVQANIGGAVVLEGPAPAYEDLAAHIEAKLEFVPRYRQRVRFLPMRLGSPVWADDPDFDIHDHLLPARLRAPGTDQQLNDYVADDACKHLDRDHPLWQIHFVEGLEGGRWALLFKVHHAMVDGVAATDILSLLLDYEPSSHVHDSSDWQPEPATRRRLIAETLSGPQGPTRPFRDIRRVMKAPRGAAARIKDAAFSVAPLGRKLIASPNHSPLNGPIGPYRRWSTAEADLNELKTIGKRLGGTVNDVVLAVVTAGIRSLLISRGEPLDEVEMRTMVPVSIRRQDEMGKFANYVSAFFVDLPVAIASPVERLRTVREQMEHQKETGGDAAGEMLFALADYVPPPLFALGERIGWRVADTKRLMNTIATNVPGPRVPLYCLGLRVTKVLPYVMLAKNIRLTTAIFSYDGGVYFGVTGDYDTVPDVKIMTDGIEAAVAELLAVSAIAAKKRPKTQRKPIASRVRKQARPAVSE